MTTRVRSSHSRTIYEQPSGEQSFVYPSTSNMCEIHEAGPYVGFEPQFTMANPLLTPTSDNYIHPSDMSKTLQQKTEQMNDSIKTKTASKSQHANHDINSAQIRNDKVPKKARKRKSNNGSKALHIECKAQHNQSVAGVHNQEMHNATKQTNGVETSTKSNGNNDDGKGNPDTTNEKRRAYRERNRNAAALCRARKRERTVDMETMQRELRLQNSSLKRTVMSLRDELTEIRTAALSHNIHDPRCNCQALHRYNCAKAAELTFDCFQPNLHLSADSLASKGSDQWQAESDLPESSYSTISSSRTPSMSHVLTQGWVMQNSYDDTACGSAQNFDVIPDNGVGQDFSNPWVS